MAQPTRLTQHQGTGFRIGLPEGWVDRTGPAGETDGLAFLGVESGHDHPASVVVTAERPDVESFADWQEKTEVSLAEQLDDYRLLDFRRHPLGDHDGVRRLATHSSQGVPITMTQFVTAPGVTGWTVTVSAPDWRYPEMVPLVEEIGSSFRCEVEA